MTNKQELLNIFRGFYSQVTLKNILELEKIVANQINKDIEKMEKKKNKSALKRYNKNMEYLKKYNLLINEFYKNPNCEKLEDLQNIWKIGE